MMLSRPPEDPGRKKIFVTRQSPRNIVARIVVARLKKSAVLRTPKTVPIDPPPNDPASPPPLLDCMRTTTINSMLTRTSSVTIIPNIIPIL